MPPYAPLFCTPFDTRPALAYVPCYLLTLSGYRPVTAVVHVRAFKFIGRVDVSREICPVGVVDRGK